MHKVELPERLRKNMIARRGRADPFDRLVGPRTALVVVDMQNAFMLPGMVVEIPVAREIVPNVNRLAHALRQSGGIVVWLKMTLDGEEKNWSVYFEHFTHPDHRADEVRSMTRGDFGHELYSELEVKPGDLIVEKRRFSAFIQGSSDLDAMLRARGIDTVLVTGAVTNVCCEATARDAMMLNYKTVMVSDANAARNDDDHNASLSAIWRVFAAVHSSEEVIALLAAGTPAASERRAASR